MPTKQINDATLASTENSPDVGSENVLRLLPQHASDRGMWDPRSNTSWNWAGTRSHPTCAASVK